MKMLSFYLEDNRGLLFHIIDGEQVVGYCGGLRCQRQGQPGSATSMTQFTFKTLVLNMLIRPWLFFHREIRENYPLIKRNIWLRLGWPDAKLKNLPVQKAEKFVPSLGLVVIGVAPDYQGEGFGSQLLKEFEHRARKEGFIRIHLSVRKNNRQAISAYKRNGWVHAKEGEKELSMYKELT